MHRYNRIELHIDTQLGVVCMTAIGPSTVTIADALDALDWTVDDLARKAGVDDQTVTRAMVSGGKISTNRKSAEAIAAALGLGTKQIVWANGITNLGRPGTTGGVPVAQPTHQREAVCPVHYIALPSSNLCDMCS